MAYQQYPTLSNNVYSVWTPSVRERQMPGRDRLQEIVDEQTKQADVASNNLRVASKQPHGLTVADVENSRRIGHEALDRAADAVTILVREGD